MSNARPAPATWDSVVQWSSQERYLIGASVFRIVAGATILLEQLINYSQRRYLFGPEGIFPWKTYADGVTTRFISLYSWSDSLTHFEVVYHLGLVVTALWMVGWRTRLLTPLTFVFWWSLHQRIPGIWDGGDNLIQLVLIYGFFANLGAHFSLDARRLAGRPPPPPWMAMLHNAAIFAFGAQLSLVYAVAGLTKVQGTTWREGTAIYYSFRSGQFLWPGVSELIYQSALLTTVLSYMTVFFQVSFPYMMMMNRYTRSAAVCIGLTFHIGIALFFGLVTFSFYMMSVDLALLDDRDYQALFRFLRRSADRIGAAFARMKTSPDSQGPATTPSKKEVDALPSSTAARSETK